MIHSATQGPVEIAIESIRQGTVELKSAIKSDQKGQEFDSTANKLQGVMAAGVNGGLNHFVYSL